MRSAPSTLRAALDLGAARVVAFTGGGGKTSALFRLAGELTPARVLVTTTTRIWAPTSPDPPLVLASSCPEALAQLAPARWPDGVRVLGTAVSPEGKLLGIPPEWVAALRTVADYVLVEADGAAGKPLTAPRSYEPVIPPAAELVVPVVGADAIGAPLDAPHVHRVAELSALLGVPAGTFLSPRLVARVLLAPEGNTRGAPPYARIVPLVNKVDGPERLAPARAVAEALLTDGAERVVLAALAREPAVVECWSREQALRPAAGVLLAAGLSTRLGRPKQLLPLGDRPLLRHVAETGLLAGLDPLVVVIGPQPAAMRAALVGLPVHVVENPRHAEGQSTSVRAGVAALPPATPAVVMLLVDMPGVTPGVIRELIAAWRATDAPIVRPQYAGRPGNPVLFDGRLLEELAAVTGDEGGRAVLRRHAAATHYVPVAEPGVVLDIDTWEAYEALLASGASGGGPLGDPRR